MVASRTESDIDGPVGVTSTTGQARKSRKSRRRALTPRSRRRARGRSAPAAPRREGDGAQPLVSQVAAGDQDAAREVAEADGEVGELAPERPPLQADEGMRVRH